MQKNTTHLSKLDYNTLGTDFKVEAIAANLLKYYNADTSIFIKRIGLNDRPYLKDLRKMYHSNFGLDEETIIMESYRESLYDYLPEGLFHPPTLGNFNRGVENVVNEIKHQKEVENNARNFFQPFELEVFNTEVTTLLKESEYSIADPSNILIDTLAEIWPLINEVDEKNAKILIYILPFLHEIKGNVKMIEDFIGAFLDLPVSITFEPNTIDSYDDIDNSTVLGNAKLGITLIPNGKHMDGERNWKINIGPVPYADIYKFIPGHAFRKLLLKIYDYLFPISVKIFEEFITEKNNHSFQLNKTENTSRLNYSTFI
ncbi:hypothetical protein [Frigoriflavimonas asaccharolytica]|uniref:Type VI secretion system (T6SS) VasB/ImpH family protein n=1 Tax=Frigoriflavimonas asaccharolytica TaxID=2735899 RepID=A0A8J8K6K2_9FLAO|nr:hypothetical protein [Frigoriflavimonas asaccharolytica]NRS93840.1 hypothetical protein [Frigoriflavimonas asaccharolytica]